MRQESLYSGLSPSLKAHHADYFRGLEAVPGSTFAQVLDKKGLLLTPDTSITTIDALTEEGFDMLLLDLDRTLGGHAAFHKKSKQWDVFHMYVVPELRKKGHNTHMARTLLWMAQKPVQFGATDESMTRLCDRLEEEGYQREGHLIYPKNE